MGEARLDSESRGLIQKFLDRFDAAESVDETVTELAEKVEGLSAELAAETKAREVAEAKAADALTETLAERATRRLREYTDLVKAQMPNVPGEPEKLAEALEWLQRADHVKDEESGNVLHERYELIVEALSTMSGLVADSPSFKALASDKDTGADPTDIKAAIANLRAQDEYKELSEEDLLIAVVARWPSFGETPADSQ